MPDLKKDVEWKKSAQFPSKMYCFMRKFHYVNGERVALWEFLQSVGLKMHVVVTPRGCPPHNLALQLSATHCNTLQHTPTHRNTLQHTVRPIVMLHIEFSTEPTFENDYQVWKIIRAIWNNFNWDVCFRSTSRYLRMTTKRGSEKTGFETPH